MNEVSHLAALGVDYGGPPKVDVDKLRAHKEKVVAKLTGGLGAMAKMRKVQVLRFIPAYGPATASYLSLRINSTKLVCNYPFMFPWSCRFIDNCHCFPWSFVCSLIHTIDCKFVHLCSFCSQLVNAINMRLRSLSILGYSA